MGIQTLTVPAVFPGAAAALGANYAYINLIEGITIVGVSAAPSADDTGLTLDINDDGTGVIDGITCDDQNVPGTWKSTAMGGSNAPVHVAAGSKLSFDANSAANATQICAVIYYLPDVVMPEPIMSAEAILSAMGAALGFDPAHVIASRIDVEQAEAVVVLRQGPKLRWHIVMPVAPDSLPADMGEHSAGDGENSAPESIVEDATGPVATMNVVETTDMQAAPKRGRKPRKSASAEA